jgi:hypothetical protein
MGDRYIPRPSTLTLKLRGSRVALLRLENEQARDLALELKRARNVAPSDRDLCDLLIAVLRLELDSQGVE